jgi:hypothetical protein
VPPAVVESEVSGVVPMMLALRLASPQLTFGQMTPGVAQVYAASVGATVTSTAGNATLSVIDSSSDDGRLANGTFKLASPLLVRATNAANPFTAFAPLGGLNNPRTLLTYPREISNDAVTISLQQPISATEPLLAGGYTKTLTFTLSTATP